MGTLLASDLITQLRVTLLDPAPGATWTDPMLLGYINAAQRAVCLVRPELNTAREAVDLVAGIDQELPAGWTALLKIDRNVASGRVCRGPVDAALVDAAQSFWPAATPETDVQDYMLDPRDRKRFRVLPPNDGDGEVMVFGGKVPTALANTGAAINLDDVYEDPLKQFVLSEAYAANTKRQDLAKAAAARGEFAKMLGINAQSLAALLPRTGVQEPGLN